MFRHKGGHWLSIKVGALIAMCIATMFMVGGCLWIQEWLTPNNPPIAVIQATPSHGIAPLEVLFDASRSYDPDGDQLVDFLWDFGDGVTRRGVSCWHGFSDPGNYTVRLTVTDARKARNSTTVGIAVWEPISTVIQHVFEGQAGTVFDTGQGLVIEIPPGAVRGQAKVVVSQTDVGYPETGALAVSSVYTVKLENVEQQQVAAPKSVSSPFAVMSFDIPPDIDPDTALILMWTEAGWIPALSHSGDCLGGQLTQDKRRIYVEVPHFSTYALGYVKLLAGEPIVLVTSSEPSVTNAGDLSFDVRLEPPRLGPIACGVWYGIDAPTGIGCKAVSSPTDPVFGSSFLGNGRGFLGPSENKVLRYICWGTGGRTTLRLSMRDGLPAALMDILFRLASGSAMPWPVPSIEAWQAAGLEAGLEGTLDLWLSTAMDLVDELNKVTSMSARLSKVWTWAKRLAKFLDFVKVVQILKYAVDQLAHYFWNWETGGEILYEVVGSVPAEVAISPREASIAPGQSVQFRAALTTRLGQDKRALSMPGGFGWETSGGGVVDQTGRFTADAQARGRFVIKATVSHIGLDGEVKRLSGEAYVTVQSSVEKPNPPRLLEPGSSSAPGPTINTLTPTLRWEAVANADRYALAISIEPYGPANVIYRNENLTGTSFPLPSGVLEYGKKYRWNMQAGNSAGWSEVSSTLYFQTPPSPTSAVTLTLYVHEGSPTGPVIVGARVQGSDAAGKGFDQTTNSSGFVTITGTPGRWSFTVSKTGYRTETWEQDITVTETRRAFLQRATQNQPPVITSLTADPSIIQVGGQSRISISAHDPENDPLTFSWSCSGGTLSGTSGPGDKIWTAPNAAGTYRITVSVTDNQPGRSPVNRSVDITVAAPSPSFDFSLSVDPTACTAAQGGLTSTTFRAWRTTGPATRVDFTVIGVPSGVSVSPATSWSWDLGDQNHTLTFNIGANTPAGTHTIRIRGTGGGVTKEATFTLIVSASSPSFNFEISVDPPSKTTTQGSVISTKVRGWRTAGPTTRVDFTVTGFPTGVTVDPQSWSWNLDDKSHAVVFSVSSNAPVGTHTITIRGTGGGVTKTATFTLTVTAPSPQLPDLVVEEIWTDPNPPFTSSDVVIGVRIRNQGDADVTVPFLLRVRLLDPQARPIYARTENISSLAAGSNYVSIPTSTARWPSDTDPYTIEAVVDPEEKVHERDRSNNVSTRQVRAINPPQPVGTLFIRSVPGEADVYVDGQYKGKTPVVTIDYLPITNLSAGEHTVKVTKSGYKDWTDTVTISPGSEIYLAVHLSILEPPVDHLPEIIRPQENEVAQAEVGKLFTYQIEARDPEGQPLVYVLQTRPSDMTIDQSTGMISWTPGSSWAGRRAEVTFYVSDRPIGQTSNREVYRTFYIDVTSVPAENQPPIIESLIANPTSVQPGGQSRITVSARDPENDPLTYNWSASGGILSSTTGAGEKIWTAPSATGTYRVTVTVTDNQPGRTPVSRSVDITVTQPNPVTGELTSTSVSPPSPAQVGQQVSFSCTVRNTSGARHTFMVGLSVWKVGSSINTAIIDTSKQITLEPGQQQAVQLATYTFASDQTGDWNYQFGLWRDQVGGTLLDKKPSPAGVLTVYKQLPDLIVEDIWTVPSPPVASDYTTIGVRIRNQGDADVTSSFLLALHFDTTYYGHVYIDGVAAGSVYTSEWRAVKWPSDTNFHTIKAIVDTDNKVLERNENNNELAKQFQAVSPPQQVGTLFIESVPGGAAVYVDGQYKGITPTTGYLRIDNLLPGDRALRVSKTGYKDWTGTVTIPPGKATYKAVILEEDVIRLPTVETRVATNITETSAILQGAIINDGGASIIERRFEWGTTPACSGGSTNQVTVSGNTFSFRLTGLQPGTTYYFRARARNSAGWGQGADLSFRTLDATVQEAGQIVSEGVSPSPGFAWRSVTFSCRVKNTGTVRHTFPVSLNVWRPGTSPSASPVTFSAKHVTLDPNQEGTVEWTTGFKEDQTGEWSYQFNLWKDAVGGTLLVQRPSPPGSLTVVKFKVGDPVYVYGTGGIGLRVRRAPCGEQIGNKPDGSTGVVLEGPVVCTLEGKTYRWWKIRWADGLEGWSVEDYLGLALG